ncbi:TIGR03620 family F420-dependent LLM class oxidoreductase [Pseudonocardia benzenivorans]|uniref:F420-dependent oxidoreductase n=2 Tax=Pseudonocardia TaxID=1847 RepID=F4CMI7_PSEUX|nr:TIGR03620 family F420-dependent LLM class oxidoreductase [Pseudonocardia dioxanivorans]AEA23614.1 putative F420-dependent oxidoreductase [Pseudonocardia dioxanivorans CB1190]
MGQTTHEASRGRVKAARAALGPIGVSVPTTGMETVPMPQQIEGIRRLEKAGYRAAWAREGVGGHDALVEIATLLGATEQLVLGSAVANMWARPAVTLHAAAATLGEAFPGRFVLGLGAGMAYQAEALGLRYARPYSLMRDYLRAMTTPVPGLPTAEQTYARIIAANGPKMVELAASAADGAHPGLIPVEYTASVRATLGPDKLLVVALTVVALADRRAARDAAGQFVVGALGFPGSPYGANLARLGYTSDEIAAGADRVVDAVMAYGRPDDIAARARAHLDAGADHVLVNCVLPGYETGIQQLEGLAPALTEITG